MDTPQNLMNGIKNVTSQPECDDAQHLAGIIDVEIEKVIRSLREANGNIMAAARDVTNPVVDEETGEQVNTSEFDEFKGLILDEMGFDA
jgi:hypothetical protein